MNDVLILQLGEKKKGSIVIEAITGATHRITECATFMGAATDVQVSRRFPCKRKTVGSIVRIRQSKQDKFTVCEVEVYGINGKTPKHNHIRSSQLNRHSNGLPQIHVSRRGATRP